MARHRGMAAIRRGRTTAYAAALTAVTALVLASPAAAQGTGGTSVEATPPQPQLSAPPPGVVVRPAPLLRAWRCVRHCDAASGAVLRVRGQRLGRTYEVVFLGGLGEDDDVAAAPVRRTKKLVTVRVPLGAVTGPLLVRDRDGNASKPSAVPVTVAAPVSLKVAGGPTTIEVQSRARRAFFDAARPATVSYVVHGGSDTHVVVELVRASDGGVVASWDQGDVPPETSQTATWDGTIGGKLQKEGRYSFRVSAVSAAGVQAVSAQARRGSPDPAAFQFLRNEFPIRGPHGYGDEIARFGGARNHQGQDTFAACGTPLVAARGGKVKFKQYQSRAGNYLVIDGERTGIDYGYMHMRSPALVDVGDRVRTGQPIGYVGRTGDATACHLHFEMWTAPGWYDGGHPFDPLPSLLSWDKAS
jgi:murein DD-endopeptidase MepM/ murein hydrolase activator NlpD